MELQLKGKVIIITGGGKGIGAAIARACAQEGAIAAIIDRDMAAGKAMVEELKTLAGKAKWIGADLALSERARRAVEEVLDEYGRIDGLVNNAGGNDHVGLEQGSPQAFGLSLQKNLFHYYDMAHYSVPYLKKTRGPIVNMASRAAVAGRGGTSGYAAAKGAVLALTREWAAELLPYNIRVNAIVPAEVMTPLYRQWLNTFPSPEAKERAIASKIPLGQRMTHAEEIASAAAFLLSEKAAHITGQHWFVDGGYVHLDRSLS